MRPTKMSCSSPDRVNESDSELWEFKKRSQKRVGLLWKSYFFAVTAQHLHLADPKSEISKKKKTFLNKNKLIELLIKHTQKNI